MSSAPSRPTADPPPAEALSDVWVLLDELPRGAASPALTATTVEMAAVQAAAQAPRTGVRAWLAPAAVVAAALVAGIVAGRSSAPDPDRLLQESLPVVRHFDLLREAGSVPFLEAVTGRGGPPLRMMLRQGAEAAKLDTSEFNDEVEELTRLVRADAAARREFIAGLSVEERAELEQSLRTFVALSGAERKALVALAEALVDPDRPELRSAALDWHRWLASSRPEDRDDIIASTTDKRLERIDWYAARIEGRGRPGQPPPWARRPPGGEFPRGPDGRPRRPPPGDGQELRDGPPRQDRPRGDGRHRESPRGGPESDGPPPLTPGAPAPPPGTPAAPD